MTTIIEHNGKPYQEIPDEPGKVFNCLECCFCDHVDKDTGECCPGLTEKCVENHVHYQEIK